MRFSTEGWWLLAHSFLTFALCILGCPVDSFSDEPPKDVSSDPAVFQTNSLPHDNATNGIDFRYMASVGNGHLATVVYSDTVYVNGLYNGALGWSHRARIPSTQAIRLQVADRQCNTTRKYSLDVARGVFEEVLAIDGMGGRVTQRTYAHQRFTRLLITEVMVDRQSATGQPFIVQLRSYPGSDSSDIKFSEQEDFVNNVWPSYQQNGTTREAELNTTVFSGNHSQALDDNEGELQTVYMFSTKLPNSLTLDLHQQKGRWLFFTSIDRDYVLAKTEFQTGLNIVSNAPDYLYQSHVKAWHSKWKRGRIEVSGNLQLQKLIYGSFYYLLSSLPSKESNLSANQFYGLSPGGLANGANATDYQGHVFWDMETWMYPTMLMFHPDLAKEMLAYRVYGMEFAYERARNGGYEGLRFPWQSAFTGAELTTVCIPCRDNEQHITGDIGFAARQYLTATRDTDWLKSEQGYQLIRDVALFWASRATYNTNKDRYDINGVMPPDEYAQFVNNSVYTNVLAQKSILFARYAACLAGLDYSKEINDSLISLAEKLFIPFNEASKYHPEFEGYENYENGTHKVKQADVILLGYPLMYNMTMDVRRNDLEKYENVTDDGGPAMTWGMFAIGWLELGDEQRAARLFNKSHSPYTREPFKIWTEDHYGHGAVNFITGMGGFLQAVFFGYGGARLHVEQLTFDPRLPPHTEGMKFIDVDYLGSRFDVHIKAERVQINVTEAPVGAELILTVISSGSQFLLTKGRLIDMAREAFSLKGSEETDCPVPEGSSCPPNVPRSNLTYTSPVIPSRMNLTDPADYLVLTHTQGSDCHTMMDCQQQASHYLDDFNYLVGENGVAYEGMGTRSTSGVTTQLTNRAITVAFLGDFRCKSPNTRALATLKRVAKCLIESGKLSKNYTVLTLEQATDSGSSAERDDAPFCTVKQWKHWRPFQSSDRELRHPKCARLCSRDIDYTVQSDGFTDLSEEPHIFRTDRLPMMAGNQSVDLKYMPSVGNGHIATVLYSSSVYMNGLFSGYKGESHRARIPSLHNIRASLIGSSTAQELWSYSLDVKRGVFEEKRETPNTTVLVRTYAHQHYTQLLVTEVRVHRSEGHMGNVTVQLESFPGKASADIDFSPDQQYYDKENRLIEGCFWRSGVTKQAEWNTSSTQKVYQYWKRLDTELVLPEGEASDTWIYISALDSDQLRAATVFQSGLWRIGDGSDRLYDSHVEAWSQKWDSGHLEVEGSTNLSKLAYSSQYYLLSSLPSLTPNFPNEQFYGLSPDSLARGGSGHVLWYMDTLAFPPVLLFHPDLAKAMLSYRQLTMPAANQRGEGAGLFFPWESGVTGFDITPHISSCTTCSDSAKHVSGDIAMAAHQYLALTQNTDWLQEKGYRLMRDIARFWKQQLLWDDQKQAFVINDVTPPDELAGKVNNSAYTNYLAKLNIHQSRYAACLSSRNYKNEIPDDWLRMADSIFMPFDFVSMVNLSYEGFTTVDPSAAKLPDVVLLAYPLMMALNHSVLRYNLERYWNLTHSNTSIMAWAMFTVNWLALEDLQRAESSFRNSYMSLIKDPFKLWKSSPSDVRDSNSVLAMSSFLQALIFGYGGVRLRNDHLEVNPKLPSKLTAMKLRGLDYLGNSIDIEIMEEKVRVTNRKMSAKKLYVSTVIGKELEIEAELGEGVEITLSRVPFYIFTVDVTECPLSMGTSFVPVVERSEWGAVSPRSPVSAVRPAVRVIVYQTADRRCTDRSACIEEVNRLQTKHMEDDNLGDVAYNFLVGEDGRVYEGRGWGTLAHFPTSSAIDNLAIGVMGDFMCEFPSDLAMAALKQLIKQGVEGGHIHWNYTLLGGRQLDNVHDMITTEDRLLCQLSKSVHWEPYQYGGMFVKPKCDKKCQQPFQTPESLFHDISDKATVFETDRLPTHKDSDELDFDYMASVGNGHLSTVVYSPTVYVNGLYNGPTGWSHRARIPALNAIRVNFTNASQDVVHRKFALDVEKAVFEEKILSPKVRVLQRTYAHQFYTRLLVTEIHVHRRPGVRGSVTFDLELNTGGASKDITFDAMENVTDDQIKECNCLYHHGRTNEAEINGTALQDIHLYWNERPESVTLRADLEKFVWTFLTAIDQNRKVAQESMEAGMRRLREGDQVLFEKHVHSWKVRWDKGRIEVDGDVYLSKRIYGSFYYLLSFLPAFDPYITSNQFYGLSPGGLANGANWTDYQGHVFWDMETWMYPTMLMFHPELAKEMLSYRIYGMKFAELRAKEGNYSGLRFPWESAFTGYEQTPDICVPCRENQLHITGDIALAARQYLTMTRDVQWLKREKGFEFIRGMADFWRSRPTWNATKQAYDVNGVMPPDEHAQSINNSVYTNVGAKISIHFARYAACLSGMNATAEVPDDWLQVANKLYLPFNSKGQYHPEFEGFEQWTDERGIKQADVILLGYPQMWPMSPEVRRNDLEMYEKITNPLGPAMTWGMYAIGWLELGDEARARELFWRSYALYVREPFKIWTEVKTGLGAVNFITGMGGFLQTVFFGYGGARIHVEHLSFDPRVPPGTTALRFVGVDYLENSFDMEITEERVRILPTKTSPDYPLVVRLSMSRAEYKFIQGEELLLPRKQFTVRTSVVTDCPVPEGNSCPLIIERSAWDADPPTWSTLARSHPAQYVILHHTTMARCFNYGNCKQQARLTEEYHKASIPHGLGLSDVGYSFLVGEDGSVFEGRGWDPPLPDILEGKKNSIGIGVLGDFSCSEPNEKVLEAIQRLIKCGVERKKIYPNYRLIGFDQIHHNDVRAERLLCEIQSWPHWHTFENSGKMMGMLDCDSPCDPTAPRTLEGDVKDESSDPTVFMTHSLPMKPGSEEVDFRYMASVGNGHLATTVYSDAVYVNGLYNGPTGWTHRARIPSHNAIRLHVQGQPSEVVKRKYALDVEKAVFEETIISPRVMVKQRTYAHQYYNRLLLTEILVTRQADANMAVMLTVNNNRGNDSIDINFKQPENYQRPEICPDGCSLMEGQTLIPETDTSPLQQITVVWKNLPAELLLEPGVSERRWLFAMSADQNRIVAEQMFDDALRQWMANHDYLYNMHVKAWREKWNRGRIEVDDNLRLSKLIYGSFYYLLSFLPSTDTFVPNNQFYGLSPGGLANGANWTDYQGHVFWDMETWMYPTMLMFHPELAKEMLSYRIYSMPPSQKRAESGGYSGLRYPWEAAFTGGEVTPDICVPCRENQQHITGDIAFAARQYLTATRDLHWLKSEKGYEFIKGMAEFWKTRPEWNEKTGYYDINGVMPPDEHQLSINNSVYTNIGAKLSIHFARYAACLAGMNDTEEIGDNWLEVARNIFIPFDDERQYHPEFQGYGNVTGEKKIVKQADVILAGFPQMWPMSATVRRNDLELYEKVTHPLGPAMTWGMFAIGWLELGDVEKAADTFHRSYSLYTREPFKVWTEARSGIGAVNFITGMGGFLQAVFFGYGGARLHVEKLNFNPRLLPGTSAVRFKGLDYLGSSLDMEIKHDSVQVICRVESRKHLLMLESLESGVRYHLKQDKEVTFAREPFTIRAVEVTECPLPEGDSCPEVVWRRTPRMVSRPHYQTVVVHQTGGNRCFDQSDCRSAAARNETSAGFHFLVGDDGRVYEGEDWDSPIDNVLKIGFIGEFTCEKPSEFAIAAAKQLIKCKVEMDMLEYDYKLFTLRQTKPPDCQTAYCPGDRLDCVLITWKAWDREQVGGMFQSPKCHGSCFLPDPSSSSHSSQYTDISDQPTLFQTKQLPMDSKTGKIDFSYMASVSNGHLATVVYSDTIYVNGLYNEHMGWSHRARIPSPNAVRVDTIVGENPDSVKRLFTLDVEKAVFIETVDTPNLKVVDRIYAHQTFTRVLITEITVTRKPAAKGSFRLKLTGNQGNASIDLEMLEERSYRENDDTILFKHAQTLVPEINNMSTSDVYVVYTITPEELTLTEDQDTKTLFLLTSVGMDVSKVTENFDIVEGMVGSSPKAIYETHVRAWREKWQRGHIEIDGNLKLSKLVYGCFYYLLSFLPSTQPFSPSQPFNGLSPGGLANGANWTDYQGHVFWDMETWMYPTMLMFHPELAKEMLSYRVRGMKYAYDRARSGGYEGLRYPWEAAQTGIEVTPDICVPCRENQLHITGDIAMAAKQFMSVTKDLDWLKSEKGYTLIKDIAKFWKSRPTWSEDKQEYEIKGVMPPDEHAQNVSNSVYTNVQAQLSIYYARYIACINDLSANTEVKDDWLHVADHLHIPFDETRMFHPEYEGYEEGLDNRGVKQADVILLGFPLMYRMSEEVRRNDLLHYERVTNAFGPAMTWGMFSIGWLELGDIDKAAELFTKSYDLYTREPFKIWTEARSGIGAVNFITGMGGFLQAVYFGYGGVRIHNEHLSFNPRLPPMTSGLRLLGMNYLGNSLDVVICHYTVSITVTQSSQLEPLYLRLLSTQAVYDLKLDVEVVIKKEAFTIASYHVSDCPYPQDPVCPTVISRREWSSSLMEEAETLMHPVGNVIVYQTSSRNCYSRQSCGKEVKSQQDSEGRVKYNFLVGEDGSVFEGRGWNLAGDHLEDFNTKSIAIVLLGNFTTAAPNKRGMAAVKLLIKCGMEIGKINETYSLLGEKQIRASSCTSCPADRLLCELMKSQRWQDYQADGLFKAPCCMEVCGVDRKTTAKPTPNPSSASILLLSRIPTLVIFIALVTGSVL